MSRDSYREDLQNPPSEGKSARSLGRDGNFQVIEADDVPPMNEDISSQEEDADPMEQAIDSAELSILKEKLACNALVP